MVLFATIFIGAISLNLLVEFASQVMQYTRPWYIPPYLSAQRPAH